MDFEKLINDALQYALETFAGHWKRWLIFVLLGLPFSLMRFVIDPRQIITTEGIRWDLIPWTSIAVLALLGIIGSVFIAGYMVRIYRGTRPAPDFTGWAALFIDGIRLDIVIIVWFLPVVILALILLGIFLGGLLGGGPIPTLGNPSLILAGLLIFLVAIILLVVISLYVTMGAIRFARTGSMAEGWRFSAVSGLIRRIGWGNYIIALVVLVIATILYGVATILPSSIPYVGWIVPVALAPFFTVFVARYYTFVYEAGEEPASPPPEPAGP